MIAAPAKRPGFVDYSLLATLALIWGGSFTLVAIALEAVPPATMSMARLLLGGLILLILAMLSGQRIEWTKQTLVLILAVGFLGNALPFCLIAWGQQTVDAGVAAILMGIMPVATLVLAHFLERDEPLTRWKILGVLTGLLGLAVLLGPSVLMQLGDNVISQFAMLVAAVSYGLNAIVTKYLLGQSRLAVAAWFLIFGALMLLPVALVFEDMAIASLTPSTIVATIALAIFPTALAALLMFNLIGRQGAGFFSQINLLVPAAGVFWAWLVLGETLEFRAFVALLIISLGVAVARIERPSHALKKEALS